MTEQAAKALAATLGGHSVFSMPGSRSWGVTVERSDGRLAVIEDHAGWVYRDRKASEAYQQVGDPDAVLDAREWSKWDDEE